MGEWFRICCAVDFSDASRLAMIEAADLAKACGAQLTLVHVHEPKVKPAGEPVASATPFEVPSADVARDLEVWKAEAERRTTTAVRTAVVTGDAVGELLRYARAHGVDLLVVGTRGRMGLRHVVLGSVAERVVRLAPCPVLVVRPKEPGALVVDRLELEQYAAAP